MSPRHVAGTGGIVAGAVVAMTVTVLKLRAWHGHWGATHDEVARPLPGDDLISEPRYQTTRAISIMAPPAAAWAWLIQLGQGRGGFYTFDRLENLAGLDMHSVDRIVPELQDLAVGDLVPLSAIGGPIVVVLDPLRTMVLHFAMDPFTGRPIEGVVPADRRRFDWTWTFALRPIDGVGTRLVVRTRADYVPRLLLAPLVAALVEPVHFLMEWGMLRGIKRRAEFPATSPTKDQECDAQSPFGS